MLHEFGLVIERLSCGFTGYIHYIMTKMVPCYCVKLLVLYVPRFLVLQTLRRRKLMRSIKFVKRIYMRGIWQSHSHIPIDPFTVLSKGKRVTLTLWTFPLDHASVQSGVQWPSRCARRGYRRSVTERTSFRIYSPN